MHGSPWLLHSDISLASKAAIRKGASIACKLLAQLCACWGGTAEGPPGVRGTPSGD